MNTKNSIISRLFSNSWFITLTATLIGVFAALYLNEWVASNKLKSQQSIATNNVLIEISSNNKKLEKVLKEHIETLDVMVFMGSYFNDEKETLITHVDSVRKFQTKHPGMLTIADSTFISNGIYDFKGTLNFNFSLPQLEITTIAWETLKDSGISSSFGFECLMYLEGVYKVTNEVISKNEELFDYAFGEKEVGEKNENLIRHLNLLIDYEESLRKIYKSSEEEIKDCS